jgi:small multidrug resistance family-3 protein
MALFATFGIYVLAALAEIAGCFAVWAWARNEASALWLLPGGLALAAFGWVLTRVDADFAGRAFAAYGGVYIVASLAWLVLVEREAPTVRDFLGVALCLSGTAVILSGAIKG